MDISVVIPLYNKEKYICRTIASVLAQTVPPSEIIVIDDGSTDNSANEVLRFDDSRIRLIRQENCGEGASRNNGVAVARHDLVAFLDADDEWKPDFLLHIQRLYRNFPDCGAYATAYEAVESDGSTVYPRVTGVPPAPWIGIIPNLFTMMQHGAPFMPSSVAMPKDAYRDLNGFPEGITQGADRMMWICLGMKYPIAYSPSRQVVYHLDATNRASGTLRPQTAAADMIDRMLEDCQVPLALVEDVSDFSAYLKIHKARALVTDGQGKSARTLLMRVKHNRKYRGQFLWWYFWSLVPYFAVRYGIKVKEQLA